MRGKTGGWLSKRDNGIWYIRYYEDGKERWKSTGTKKRSDAALALTAWRKGPADPEPECVADPVAAELFDVYAKAMANQLSPKTLEAREWAWNRSRTAFAPRVLSDITQDLVRAHRASYKGNEVTYNSWLRNMRTMYKQLAELGLYSGECPFHAVKYMDEPDTPVEVLTWEHIEYLCWVAAHHYITTPPQGGGNRTNVHMVFVLGGYFGLRAGEISAARWEHVDWRLNTLRVVSGDEFQTKSRKSRTIPLFNNARPWLEAERRDSGFIYSPDRPSPVIDFTRAFGTVCAKAGLPHVYPHLLRHSFVSNKLMDGKPPAKVASWSGHSTLQIQEVYKHYIPHTADDLD